MLNMPIAAMLPSSVETAAAIRAIVNVFSMASTSECRTPPEKSDVYRLVENPVQLPKTLASVNENMAMMSIGA